SVRDALSVADMCLSYSASDITYEKVLEVLGANNPLIITDITANIFTGNLPAALSAIEKTSALGKSIPALARDITKLLRDLLIIKNDSRANSFLQLPDKIYEEARAVADKATSPMILRALEILSSVDMNMKYSTFPRILLETAVSKAATMDGESNLDLISKIDSLEQRINKGIVVQNTAQNPSNNDSNSINNPDRIHNVDNDRANNDEDAKILAQDGIKELEAPPINIQLISDILDRSTKSEISKVKGDLVNKLRQNKATMLSIMVGDNDTLVKVCEDKTVCILFTKDSDRAFCERNESVLKAYLSEMLGYDCKVKLDLYKNRTDDDNLKKIVALFGSAAVIINNN
ncbi:MAG: hypothetical protein EOM87_10290, partial [Clostridia bacterium]|nr:hypothetical protein [Clostridia bacterium]